MSRALALKLNSEFALAVIVRTGGDSIVVESAVRIPLGEGDDAQVRGEAIAEGLASLDPGRLRTVVAVPRSDLSWQNYDLPPAPADDLPELVYLQAQRDLPLADDGDGFDFLPLSGDEEHPHCVLGVGILPAELLRIRETCEAAGLKLERIIPEPIGWPELGRRAVPGTDKVGVLTVFAVMADRQAAVWASDSEALRMVRTLWLTEEQDEASDVDALGSELRRTLLAISSTQTGDRPIRCVYCGLHALEIAGQLGARLSRPVLAVPLERLVSMPTANEAAAGLVEITPLAALAAITADRVKPMMDLLHPRRRPVPPSRVRRHVLAASAAAAVLGYAAWQGYGHLQTDVRAAAAADAERQSLAPLLKDLGVDEVKATAVRTWLEESANLLDEIDQVSQQLRPESLDSDAFKADQDVVLTKLVLSNHELTLDAAATNIDAVQPAELRLRKANYRVDRSKVDANGKGVPGYGAGVVVTVERAQAEKDAAEAKP